MELTPSPSSGELGICLKTMMSAEKCARIAVRAMYRGKAAVVPGFKNRMGAFFAKHLPTSWVTATVAKMFRPPD